MVNSKKQEKQLNIGLLIITILAAAFMLFVSFQRLHVETDITASLPAHNPVIHDALYFFDHHPIQDRVVISAGLGTRDPERLVKFAAIVEEKLWASGLFSSVGMDHYQEIMPELMTLVVKTLPVQFTRTQLETQVAPRLTPGAVRETLSQTYSRLLSLDEIGSSEFIAVDPLGLKNIVLARLKSLAPVDDFNIYKGKLLSRDSQHCLIMATPKGSGTDSKFSTRAMELIHTIQTQAQIQFSRPGEHAVLTSVGAFRAAYDNEKIIKHDVQTAILIATAAIILLLCLAFPRPWIGLLALVPAMFGTIAGLFTYSLLYDNISLIVLGFGGAIISITIDHGITYLLFLDQPRKTSGRQASTEVRAVGLIATLTTVCAFLSLGMSDFKILEELGKFTALGMGFSFVFIHSLFPRIVPVLYPAKPRALPLQRLVNALIIPGNGGAWFALAVTLVLMWFAWPVFHVDLSAMSTVSRETRDADTKFYETWGKGFTGKSHLMLTADSVPELQDLSDQLADRVSAIQTQGIPASGTTLSMIFPGKIKKQENHEAWVQFWSKERISAFTQNLSREAERLGFTRDAFDPFLNLLVPTDLPAGPVVIPQALYPIMGISQARATGGHWAWTTSVMRNPDVDVKSFYETFSKVATVFEPQLFSTTLGTLLYTTFVKMFFIIAGAVLILLFIFFLDIKLTIITMLPVFFAFIGTLGTMKLLGHNLDIPSLMLSIIVFGIGIDFSLFFVRAYQRYRDESHPSVELIRLAVFMAGISTMIGFGVMCLAEHSLLQSAGLASLLGIGFCLAGAFLVLPPLLRRYFILSTAKSTVFQKPGTSVASRILARYRTAEAYPRMFARFKLKLDPMFRELPDILTDRDNVSRIMDIGTGLGVPACFLLERFPQARIFGIEPDPESRRIGAMAVSERGRVDLGSAPDLPAVSEPVHLALMLDMAHFLTPDEFRQTLEKIRAAITPGGTLIIRAIISPAAKPTLVWHIEALKLKLKGVVPHYLSVQAITDLINAADFRMEYTKVSGNNPETVWFVAKVSP
ncbi:MMPL family protein [Desulfobacter hydrogenophilus]|uniref:MMPL family protein n=1 Tax=Desulfobacter hydrogenophilus TaxID=2291 RepID=A0A328FA99_9BACT|nr:MMPL family transporter [Desulfobacter hydrogenophilus]NDY72582.1 MMPL family transporter [Desulfobacter hydrogenophilus]QBH13304.1 methyltransferase domain-containing protein [Desulfobacter hydrogenophilus]RAM01299.1 MMPL family protein [Desulfobacter hydrogenophilus]